MATPDGSKVVIRTPDGKYFCADANGLTFESNVYQAVLLDPEQGNLQAILSDLSEATGLALEAVPLKLEEVFEVCDRCGQWNLPLSIYFDGRRYLCPECRNREASPV